ncbi:MAG TPA: type II toxin-antitoxin system MqsR family toxin [Pyrinomonadaceae bacterium]|nr:type II toxin-antitoxin system MqsR family toxin [Pyrinomonadaceae bacterium]
MGKVATLDEVRDFLKRFKQTASEPGKWILANRTKNLSGITTLGIAVADVKPTVLALTEAEYKSGPEADRDGSSGEIWTFEVDYLGRTVYIKLKLDQKRAKCLSFHPSGWHL